MSKAMTITFDAVNVNTATRTSNYLHVVAETEFPDEVLSNFSPDEIIQNYTNLYELHIALKSFYNED